MENLDNMPPGNATSNLTHRYLVNTQQLGQLDSGQVTLPNHPHVGFGQASAMVAFTMRRTSAQSHLSHVLSLSAEMQMLRLNTDRPITGVKNVQSGCGSFEDGVRDDMSASLFAAEVEDAISTRRVNTCGPIPTSIGWVSGHEPFEDFTFGRKASWPGTTTRHAIHTMAGRPR